MFRQLDAAAIIVCDDKLLRVAEMASDSNFPTTRPPWLYSVLVLVAEIG